MFEQDSMRIQGELLQLVRTSDQLSHTANVDVTSLRQRLQAVDELAQDFMLRMDARRKNIATAINFYRLASKVRYQHDYAMLCIPDMTGLGFVLGCSLVEVRHTFHIDFFKIAILLGCDTGN